MKLERIQEAFKRYGVSRSTGYKMIEDGLFIKPIQIYRRASAIPGNELDELIKARISGLSEDEIRSVVSRLHAERQQMIGDSV